MSAHTPGPWHFEWADSDYYVTPSEDKSVGIATVMPIDRGGDKDYFYGAMTDANARLLAAAPELLAVAKHAQEWTDPESVLGIRLAEVIAKATGQPA